MDAEIILFIYCRQMCYSGNDNGGNNNHAAQTIYHGTSPIIKRKQSISDIQIFVFTAMPDIVYFLLHQRKDHAYVPKQIVQRGIL